MNEFILKNMIEIFLFYGLIVPFCITVNGTAICIIVKMFRGEII